MTPAHSNGFGGWSTPRWTHRQKLSGGRVVAWVVILAAAFAVLAGVIVPRAAGATPYTVLTGSMRPGLPPGTLVVVRPAAPASIRAGDVITYQLRSGDPTVATHRVVATGRGHDGQYRFQLQGDANNAPDPAWVEPVQIKGRLWYAVPYLGYANRLLTVRQHQWFVDAVAFALLGYAGVMFGSAVRERRRTAAGRGRHRRVAA